MSSSGAWRRCATTFRRCRFAELEKLMRKEFGGPLGGVFSDFDEQAFAAASIGQVHRATTVDGDGRGREDPVPRGGGGGRDGSAQRDAAAAAGQAACAGARCQGAGLGDARAHLGGARLRARGPEPAPHRAPDAGTPVRPRAARSTRTSRPAGCSYPSTSRARASRPCAAPTRRSATATARSSSGSTSGCSTATGSPSAIRTPATTC